MQIVSITSSRAKHVYINNSSVLVTASRKKKAFMTVDSNLHAIKIFVLFYNIITETVSDDSIVR